MKRVLVIGSGPAGLTAAIYTARAGIDTTVLEGMKPGGQLTETTAVENFPGFPEGIQGPELMAAMRAQAEKMGASFLFGDASEVDFSGPVKKATHMMGEAEAEAVVLATGAAANWLGLPSEKAFQGRGVSACATCDAPFFRGKDVMVVGGGDAAMTEACHLATFARRVVLVHRRQGFRAARVMIDRVRSHPSIELVLDTVVEEILPGASGTVGSVRVRNVAEDAVSEIPVQGVFVAIGHTPATQVFRGHVDMDEKGYIRVHDGTHTSCEGVFAAGDVVDPTYKQAVLAAGMGCMAALDADRYLAG